MTGDKYSDRVKQCLQAAQNEALLRGHLPYRYVGIYGEAFSGAAYWGAARICRL